MYFEKVPAKKSKKGYVWRVVFSYTDVYGSKRKYSKSGFTTKAEAEKHGIMKEQELTKTGLLSSDITIEQAYREWIDLNASRLADNTVRNYRTQYNHLIPIAHMPMRLIQYGQLQHLFNEVEGSKDTKKNLKTLLMNLFKYAIKNGYITNNPVPYIELTGAPKKPTEDPLELSEVESICANIKARSPYKVRAYEMFVWIGYYTGLRAREILALEWNDVDFSSNTINVTKAQEGTTRAITNRLKTESSRAVIPLCEPLKALLIDWRRESPDGFIVGNVDGSCVSYHSVHDALKKAGNRVGIHFHCHRLRHTFITNLVRSGADPKTAAQLARHANVHMTLDIYTQMKQEDLSGTLRKVFPAPEKPQIPVLLRA